MFAPAKGEAESATIRWLRDIRPIITPTQLKLMGFCRCVNDCVRNQVSPDCIVGNLRDCRRFSDETVELCSSTLRTGQSLADAATD